MFTELHRDEEREEGGRGGQEDKRGIKTRETDVASNQFQVFFKAQNTQRDSQSWVEKRRGREEIEATWWRERRVKRGERAIKPVISLLSLNGY